MRRWLGVRVVALLAAAACPVPASRSVEAGQRGGAAKLETVVVVSDRAAVMVGEKVVATVGKGRRFGVTGRQGDLVEVHVCVGTNVQRGWLHTRHVKFLTDDDVDLATEALTIAKALNPKMDVAAYTARLDQTKGSSLGLSLLYLCGAREAGCGRKWSPH